MPFLAILLIGLGSFEPILGPFLGWGGPFLDIFGILGPKMGSKVPYLISGIARNGNYYLPCDFEPNP